MEQTLKTIDENGIVPESRIPTAVEARGLLSIVRQADEKSAWNRSASQKQIDGHPPFNEAEMKKLGMGNCSNLNFGEAQADMDRAVAAFNDMLSSQERMAMIKMKSNYATPSLRQDLADKIAMAYHKVNTDHWDEYYFEKQMIAFYFNKDGVGIYVFSNSRDPRWRAEGLDNFKMCRNIKATEGKVEYAFTYHPFQAHELYGCIKDEADAKALGWNRDVGIEAIKKACDKKAGKVTDWAEIEKRLKNNDAYWTSAQASEIPTWGCYVREMDGTYSYHIFLEDGDSDYLYSKIGCFEKATQAFIISTYGIGTNGCYHGIRGLAQRIFPFVEHSNRLRNKALDGAGQSQSLMFEAEDASIAQRASIAHMGAFSILPTGLKPVPIVMPNPSITVLPVIADLERTRMNNTGGFVSSGGGSVERRELEIRQEIAHQSVLPSSSINLFMISLNKLMTEQLRRLCLDDWVEGEEGYEMAKAFRDLLEESGVPLEALKHIEKITAARALGAGSPSARQIALEEMSDLFPHFDEVGQNNYMRDRVGGLAGFDQVDRYVMPLASRERPVIDRKIADLENTDLRQGVPIEVLDNEDDTVHLRVHIPALVMTAHGLQQGGDVAEALRFFMVGLPHAEQHLGRLSNDPAGLTMAKTSKKVLDGLNKMAGELLSVVQKHQQEQQQPGAQQGPPQLSPEMQAKIAQSNATIQLAQAEAQAKMKIKEAEAMQRMQLRDAREAQNLKLKIQRQQVTEMTTS